MYAVLAGGGKVGRSIAVDLLAEGHEVTIIELIEDRCAQLLRDHDLLVIHGDACDVRYLQQARLDRADVFVATTHDDDDNFVSCQLALASFAVPRAIARVNAPDNEDIFDRMNIEAVSTTSLISRLIREEVAVGELIHLYTLRAGKVNLVEIDIPTRDGPPPRAIADLGLPRQSVLVCIFREVDGTERLEIPRGDVELLPGDQVIALTTPDLEDELRAAVLAERDDE